MRRWIILATACLLVLVIVVAPVAVIGAAVFTESGLQFLIRHIPQRFGSGPGAVYLKITGVTGTVARGLHADRVEIDHRVQLCQQLRDLSTASVRATVGQ